MKVSVDWIRSLLVGKRPPAEEIADRLGKAGIEVEGLERQADALRGLIVGEVRSVAAHPNADALKVTEVFDGGSTSVVVCGAPNVAVGQRVALARPGVTLRGGIQIAVRSIRGVESHGMLCSAAELGIGSDGAGILVLSEDAEAGADLASTLGRTDVVLELSVGPNRPDLLSHYGIAREVAAIFGIAAKTLETNVTEAGGRVGESASIEVEDPAGCPRYLARVIRGVTVGPSPKWVVDRLEAVGLRSISNVVDATNLALLELGHPLHAFDLDKLGAQKIVVRRARSEESIETIDGKSRALDRADLVIADEARPVAIAGVMGGAGTEVAATTKDVLLECALFDAKSVRRTSKRHALHTEASHRFERGIDPGAITLAVDRCAALIQELAGGKVARGRIDVKAKAPRKARVSIRPERASLVLGRTVTTKEIKESLGALGFEVVKSASSKAPLVFEPPSWRLDATLEEDLIEEVARISGFDSIPPIVPSGPTAVWNRAPLEDREGRVRTILAALGLFEHVSLAFVSPAQHAALGLTGQEVELLNPLGEETSRMRMSMLPGLLRAVRHNQAVMSTSLRLFELGRVFAWENGAPTDPRGRLPVESHRLGIVLRGRRAPDVLGYDAGNVDAFDVKGLLEGLFEAVGVDAAQVSWEPTSAPHLHPRSATLVKAAGAALGTFGELHPDVMSSPVFELEGPIPIVAELDVDMLFAAIGSRKVFRPIPRLPPVDRDLSFYVTAEASAARLLEIVRSRAGEELEAVRVFDVYTGKGVPEGQKSLALSMRFRAAERTLTDQEVDSRLAAVMSALESEAGAEVRKG
ncbi:MAG: phenylalanine--tRNA ligase subunit beta [Deltaproteobacteria bacterium]|nr:phenylalanine--tRNA ligase subunit beta [Deltaproteobacteria bacterium]